MKAYPTWNWMMIIRRAQSLPLFPLIFVQQQLLIKLTSRMLRVEFLAFQQKYREEGSIGHGSFGHIIKIRDKKDGRAYALKKILLPSTSPAHRAQILRQIQIMSQCSHPNVIQVFGYYQLRVRKPLHADALEFGLILELSKCSLEQVIRSRKIYPQEQILQFAAKFVSLLAEFQRKGIVHRDIKPDNILLNSPQTLVDFKLCDFGLACEGEKRPPGVAGSQHYASPKLKINFKKNRGIVITNPYKDDMYSLGMTIYELATSQLAKGDIRHPYDEVLRYTKSEHLAELVQAMMSWEQSNRMDFRQLEQHQLIQSIRYKREQIRQEEEEQYRKQKQQEELYRKKQEEQYRQQKQREHKLEEIHHRIGEAFYHQLQHKQQQAEYRQYRQYEPVMEYEMIAQTQMKQSQSQEYRLMYDRTQNQSKYEFAKQEDKAARKTKPRSLKPLFTHVHIPHAIFSMHWMQGYLLLGCKDGTLLAMHIQQERIIQVLVVHNQKYAKPHSKHISWIGEDNNGNVWTASLDGSILVWDSCKLRHALTHQQQYLVKNQQNIFNTKKAEVLSVVCDQKTQNTYDNGIFTRIVPIPNIGGISYVLAISEQYFVVGYFNGYVYIRYGNGQSTQMRLSHQPITQIVMGKNNEIYVAGWDGMVRVIERERKGWKIIQLGSPVISLKVQQSLIYTTTIDGKVYTINNGTATASLLARLEIPSNSSLMAVLSSCYLTQNGYLLQEKEFNHQYIKMKELHHSKSKGWNCMAAIQSTEIAMASLQGDIAIIRT